MMRGVALCALLVVLLWSCDSIVGIETRTYEVSVSPCLSYCDTVSEHCGGLLYANEEECLAVCGKLPVGELGEDEGVDADEVAPGNTLACRLAQARLAAVAGEPVPYCANAGPTGGSVCVDETPCDNFCRLALRVCPEEFNASDKVQLDADGLSACKRRCLALSSIAADDPRGGYDRERDARGDTLQCRFHYLSAAALDPELCRAASIRPALLTEGADENKSCLRRSDEDLPACDDYCRVISVACPHDIALYESAGQCRAACEAMEPGQRGDYGPDTLGCRQTHGYNAMYHDPELHCAHAAPGGGGSCPQSTTSGCLGYCTQLFYHCADYATVEFADVGTCERSCAMEFRDEEEQLRLSGYNWRAARSSAGLDCRMLHALRAGTASFERQGSLCNSALGRGACAPD